MTKNILASTHKLSLPMAALSVATASLLLISAANLAGFSVAFPLVHAAEGIKIPSPSAAIKETPGRQVIIFAGGCFWGLEGVFEHVKGVTNVQSGYAGGTKTDADYGTVSNGGTGHAEAVRVYYNPKVISYNQLMHIFFSVAHDPTQLNKQYPDTGTQYRSAIFPVTTAQTKATRAYLTQLSAKSPWGKRPVTKVETGTFYPAEGYHQDYMAKNPSQPYIRAYDAPKLVSLKRLFPALYR
jgi:peptide-methionine (S)-S-oxide reductase